MSHQTDLCAYDLTYAYDEMGNLTGWESEAALGLMYYVARWYDVSIGHFTQADTIVPGAGNPAAWNRYAYTVYNPMKYTDPSGHIPIIDFGLNPEDYHSTESFENNEHTENISDCLIYGESLYIEVEITADNWDNYLRSLERKGSDVDKRAFLLHLIVGLAGAGIGGVLGTLVSSPIGGAVAAVGTFAIAEGLAYILPSGARDAFQMNDVILALDEQFAELGDHETVVLTVFHNSGPPENHPASNGYSLRVDGEILMSISDYVGRNVIKAFQEADI